MAVFTHLETDTGTNVDISSATAVGAYTANADKLVMCDVSIDAVAGNGDYVMYVTRQIGGSGSAYRILPQTTMAAASGLTAISGQSGWITVRNGDVLTVYVDGLAGDTTTPDWTTRWFEDAGVTAASVADAVLDEATSGHTSAGSFSKAVTDILADTGTDGVVVASGQTVATVTNLTNLPTMPADWVTASGLKADAVTEIQNGLALEATLTAIKGAGWTTETLKVIKDAVTNVDGDVADVFDDVGDVLDKLNVSTVQFVTSVVGSTITILRGDTLSASLLNLGSMESYVSLDFTVKASTHQSDDAALIRVRKNASGLTDGLLRLNGAAHTTGTDGSITINDAPTGDITIMLKATVTDDLVPGTYVYDIQLIEANGVSTLTTGSLIVTADVTRLVA